MPVIDSLLDTDLYKLSMQQVALNRFPTANVIYDFRCRDKSVDLRPFTEEILEELRAWSDLRFTPDETAYLRSIRWFKPDYIDFLERYKPRFEDLRVDTTGGELAIRVEGTWSQTILWEVPLLAIVCEVYFRNVHPGAEAEGERRLKKKIDLLKDRMRQDASVGDLFKFAEFGTRRRYSQSWQKQVVTTLNKTLSSSVMLGTSNVLLAKELGLKPFGTMAHEYLQVCQAYAPLPRFLEYALEQWAQEYRGDLGIALSDVVGMDPFLRAFDLYCCKLFDGARHDSGDPGVWCEKLINHYNSYGIDPLTKTAVFSDGLNFDSAWNLTSEYGNRIRVVHGIGTNLTNDMGAPALNIVMKVVQCNGQPVAKISDSPGKLMCHDEVYLAYLAKVFNIDHLLGKS